ncbi:MAG: gamma-glutamyl-gamma-aminobutyrate hydrolase family protein [Gammaproteobacteria bacterium]|nr:gamma-glutamyl-gamma-aminobutyrate hydrolase family protein [Gammaproteobacteria bacterium]
MKTAVIVRHVAYEGLGLFTRVLELKGYDIIYMDAGVADLSRAITTQADILIVLGGPVSINDMVRFPYLVDELKLVENRLKNHLPVLGIGLGAQIMAKALGASVYPMSEQEYGWAPVQIHTDSDVIKPLSAMHVLHWHSNGFSLPVGAQLLASTAKCVVQAFSWEKSMALQFHAEVDVTKFEQWVLGHANEIQLSEPRCLYELRAGAEKYGPLLAKQSTSMMANWLDSQADVK